jgi:Holliday junction resolvase RusA-like endonuclease
MVNQLELLALPPPTGRGLPLAAFRLELSPQVAQRGRCGCRAGHGYVYDDEGYKAWKKLAVPSVMAYLEGKGDDWTGAISCPMVVQVVAVFARPAKEPRTYTVKSQVLRHPWPWPDGRFIHTGPEDLDNLRKAVLDVMQQAGVILDDRLAGEDGNSRKVWAARGEAPCVEVRVWRA